MRAANQFILTGITSLVCLAVGGVALAQVAVAPASQRLPGEAVIRFEGSSTLHDFSGTVPAQPFVIVLSSNSWSAEAFAFAGEMTTASEGRDRNMWKLFATNSYPRLQGVVKDAPFPGPGGTNVILVLRIRDLTNALPATVSNWQEDAGTVRFHAEWDVSLKQYNLKPPSVAAVIRVKDRVHVSADVTARKPATPPHSPAAEARPLSQP